MRTSRLPASACLLGAAILLLPAASDPQGPRRQGQDEELAGLQSRVERLARRVGQSGPGPAPRRVAAYRPQLEYWARRLNEMAGAAVLDAVGRGLDRLEALIEREEMSLLRSSRRASASGRDGASAVGPITGTVTDEATGAPLAGVVVRVYDRDGAEVAAGLTDASGEYSAAIASVCRVYPSGDVPKILPEDEVGVVATSTLTVPAEQAGTITDVNVLGLRGTHSWVGDLDFRLVSPAGTNLEIVDVSTAGCTNEDNFDITLDDEAANPGGAIPCPPADGMAYQTNAGSPLSLFDGEPSGGVWVLQVVDGFAPDGADGELSAWQLEICVDGDPPQPLHATTESPPTSTRIDELFDDLVCEPSCDPTTGTPISGIFTGIDFALGQGTSISGRVRESGTSSPLAGVTVSVYDAEGAVVGIDTTGLLGAWEVLVPPDGVYFALAEKNSAPQGVSHINQLYSGIECALGCLATTGTPILASPSRAPVTAIDFDLDRGGAIGGTITDLSTGSPLAGIEVEVWDAFGSIALESVTTDGTGAYLSERGYVAGSYRVRTTDATLGGYHDELFDDLLCGPSCDGREIQLGTPVGLTAAQVRIDVDFELSDQTGSISGQVRENGGGPLEGIVVSASGLWGVGRSVLTDAAGSYTIGSLPPGSYLVRTAAPFGTDYIDEVYDDVLCRFFCDLTAGSTIAVVANQSTGGISFGLDRGGVIEGAVRDAGGSPVTDTTVQILDASGSYASFSGVNAGGEYRFLRLPTGSYRVLTRNNAGLIDELYDGVPCVGAGCDLSAGTPLAVTAGTGEVVSGIDFALEPGGAISGTVTDLATGLPVGTSLVAVFDASGNLIGGSVVGGSGEYDTRIGSGLPSGSYRVVVTDSSSDVYVDELYDDLPCPSPSSFAPSCDVVGGTSVVVTAPATRTGVDFALRVGGTIEGDVADPLGNPLGASVSVYDAGGNRVSKSSGIRPYVVGGLPAGSFFVLAAELDYWTAELYDDVPCPNGACDPTSGQSVPVSLGVTTEGIDFTLEGGGRVRGHVEDTSGNSIDGATVTLYDGNGEPLGTEDVSFFGFYSFQGAPPGTLYATAGAPGFGTELFPDLPCPGGSCDPTAGAPILVSAGNALFGVDFVLDPALTLTVTRSGSGSGTVTGPGIDCGSDCSETLLAASPVALSAVAAAGSTFTGWTGAPGCGQSSACTVTPGAELVVDARFTLSSQVLFLDGFESGNVADWSSAVP